jgi:hypothetical protein
MPTLLAQATLETILPDFIEHLKELDMDDLHMEDAQNDLAAHLRRWLNNRDLLYIEIPFEKELGYITDHWIPDGESRICTSPRDGSSLGMHTFDRLPAETQRVLCITVIYNLKDLGHPRWQDAIDEVLK